MLNLIYFLCIIFAAYEVLSDEEKRKNYDLYGDEKGAPRFEGGNRGGEQGGYTYFTSGGPGSDQFTYGPGGQWERMGSQGESFSFSFGGEPNAGGGSFSFGDIFSDIFGGDMKSDNMFGGFSRPDREKAAGIREINSQMFNKEIVEQSVTWVLLFYTPSIKSYHVVEPIVQDVASSLQGMVKVMCHSKFPYKLFTSISTSSYVHALTYPIIYK